MAGQFGYTVQYEGVGKAPTGQEHLGFCTQIAQFHRTAEEAAVCEETDTPYTLVGAMNKSPKAVLHFRPNPHWTRTRNASKWHLCL